MTQIEWYLVSSGGRFIATSLVHSNLLIAFAATGVAVTTIAVAELPFEALPVLFVLGATWFAYTVNRFTDRKEDQRNLPERTAFIDRYGYSLFAITAIVYVCLLGIVAWWEPRMLPVAILPALAIGLYATGMMARFFLIKNGFVGAVWAAIPLGLASYYHVLRTPEILLIASFIFVLISVAAALFDIKDIAGDRAVGCRTLPILVGPRRTRQLALGVIIMLVPVIGMATIMVSFRFVVFGLYVVYFLLAIPFASPDRGPLYYGLVIDGEHVLVGAVAMLLWIGPR